MIIERKWDSWNGIKNGAGGLLLGYAMIYVIKAANDQNQTNSLPKALMIDAFLAVFVALAVYLVIRGLYSIIDSTTIRITPVTLSTRHHPIPWRTKSFSVQDIKQVFVQSRREQDLLGGSSTGNNGRKTSPMVYAVRLIMTDGTQPILVTQLFHSAQANFIERQIEQHLQIKDVKPKSELIM